MFIVEISVLLTIKSIHCTMIYHCKSVCLYGLSRKFKYLSTFFIQIKIHLFQGYEYKFNTIGLAKLFNSIFLNFRKIHFVILKYWKLSRSDMFFFAMRKRPYHI